MKSLIERLFGLSGSRSARAPAASEADQSAGRRMLECRHCHLKVGVRVTRCPRCGAKFSAEGTWSNPAANPGP